MNLVPDNIDNNDNGNNFRIGIFCIGFARLNTTIGSAKNLTNCFKSYKLIPRLSL